MPLNVLPIIDVEKHVPAAITAVRRSEGWPGLFLQERRGPAGFVSYLGGPRQHILYTHLKACQAEIIIGDNTKRVQYFAGESRFTPSSHSVEFRWKKEAHVLVLGIEPWFLQGIAAELGTTPVFAAEINFTKLRADHAASVLMNQMGQELQSSPGETMVAEGLARAIVVQLLREFGGVRSGKPQQAAPPIAVLRAVELMRRKLAQSLTLEEIAKASGVSAFHFARQFKVATGHPPHEYLMRLRVDHAQELIARHGRDWTLAAIAQDSGFADQSHMSRHFRRVLGVTPGEFAEAFRVAR